MLQIVTDEFCQMIHVEKEQEMDSQCLTACLQTPCESIVPGKSEEKT